LLVYAISLGAAGTVATLGALQWLPALVMTLLAGLLAGALLWMFMTGRAGLTAGAGGADRSVHSARQAVPELTKTAHTLADLADSIAGGASDQASHVAEVAGALKNLSHSVAEVAAHARTVSAAAELTVGSAGTGSTRAQNAIAAIQRVVVSVDRSASVMEKLEETQSRIASVVEVIRHVANETNLLALNAAIEAARAGQHGAGFAVVAGEVRELANRTKAATSEITEMVSAVAAEIALAVEGMRAVKQEVENGVRLADEAGAGFEAIRRQTDEVRAMIARIARAAENQSTTTADVASTVESLAGSSTETSRRAGQVSQASQTLWVLADELGRTLSARESTLALQRWGGRYVLKLSGIQSRALVPQAVLHMADRIEARSGGRLRVARAAVDQEVGERHLVSDLRRGANAYGFVSAVVVSNYVPELQVLGLPYAFGSSAELYRALDGPLGRRLAERLRSLGLVALGCLNMGARHLTSAHRPLRRPHDLQDLSMRVMESSVTKATARALGARPHAMTLPEFQKALAAGQLDAADGTLDNIHQLAIHRRHRHLTLTGHAHTPTFLVVSRVILEALPPDLQRVVEEAAREAIAWGRGEAERLEARALQSLQAEGVQPVTPAPEERDEFVEATRAVWDQFQGVVGGELMRELLTVVGRRTNSLSTVRVETPPAPALLRQGRDQ
jgi:TRAP-type C4-dicarboxylate transport system substrate-binding protein